MFKYPGRPLDQSDYDWKVAGSLGRRGRCWAVSGNAMEGGGKANLIGEVL